MTKRIPKNRASDDIISPIYDTASARGACNAFDYVLRNGQALITAVDTGEANWEEAFKTLFGSTLVLARQAAELYAEHCEKSFDVLGIEPPDLSDMPPLPEALQQQVDAMDDADDEAPVVH